MLYKFSRYLTLLFVIPVLSACALSKPDIDNISESRAIVLDASFVEIVEKHKINTAGVAVIKNNKVIWSNQYGVQSEGIPASPNTLFNIASLTKTISAETILRLAAQGRLSLDESIAPYWIDNDLREHPSVKELTPRMLLTHTSGFLNWRYFSDDRKLDFVHPPGTVFGYSGEGFEYLAKYAEEKLNIPFEDLVKSTIFEPIGMKNAYLSVDEANFKHMAKPLDQNDKFYGYYCSPYGFCSEQGSYSAAANLVITVEDYAKFLISSMNGEGLNPQLKNDRNTMQGIQFNESSIDCGDALDIQCPTTLGYGLGWSMSQLQDDKLIGHRGTTWSVVSIAYYYEGSRDGLVIFFNAPNKAGIAAMIDALTLLDPDSPEIHGYKLRLARTN